MLKRRKPLLQVAAQILDLVQRLLVRILGHDRRTEVHVQRGDFKIRQAGGEFVGGHGALEIDTKLVLFFPGAGVLVGLRVDIRVHPDRDASGQADAPTDRRDALEFRLGLHGEVENVFPQRIFDFGLGFAHAGKHDFIRRHAGAPGAVEFAGRHDIGAGTLGGEGLDDGGVGVRFHRETDQRIHRGHHLLQRAKAILQVRATVDIQRGAVGGGQFGHRNILGKQISVSVGKFVHVMVNLVVLTSAFHNSSGVSAASNRSRVVSSRKAWVRPASSFK